MKATAAAPPGAADPKRRLRLLVGVLAAVAALAALSFWSGDGGTPARPEAAAASRPVRVAAGLDPAAVPELQLAGSRGAARAEPSRNVFRFYDSPTPTATPVKPTPTPLVWYVLPDFPTATPTPTPIVPPAVPFKAIGRFGPREAPIVALEDGARLVNVREGDVVDGRFKVHKINRESVDFSFVGLPPDIFRRIPLPLP